MNTQPAIIILVGITGDLSRRKLLPAINALAHQRTLPDAFKLVGITRRDNVDMDELFTAIADTAFLKKNTSLFTMGLDNADDYMRLSDELKNIEDGFGTPAQRIFYLSVAPTVSLPIVRHLGESGLASQPDTKLMLEKPFGTDFEDAQKTIREVDEYFSKDQTYRVDHYLAKASVRTMATTPLHPDRMSRITVTAAEKIAIEGRADFYEQTGALRDFIQSHLLQVAATAIDPDDRIEALKSMSVTDGGVRRGQYEGYRAAAGNPESTIETYISVTLRSEGIFNGTVVLQTGKALDRKSTEMEITYEDGHHTTIALNDTTNAYESVYRDAIAGAKDFFVTEEEVMETWRIIKPIQDAWKKGSDDLVIYPQGVSEKEL